MSPVDPGEPLGPPQESADAETALLEAVRAILLKQDRDTLRLLEARLLHIERQDQAGQQALQTELQQTRVDLHGVQGQVAYLERKSHESTEGLVERLTPAMTNLIRRTIHDSPQEMAEAIGPVMGEAIRVQIRDSREDMVEALYPVIGETTQKAMAEFIREIQHNIDGRLRSALGPGGILRQLNARLRGVSGAELALRDALPFNVQQLFLIQHGSGLLMAHIDLTESEARDSDLVGAMLTAIRDFGRDVFAHSSEAEKDLDEISYGDRRIIIQSGRYAYLAVVFTGIEPAGVHSKLGNFVSELHIRDGNVLRDYNGDPSLLPNFDPQLRQLASDLVMKEESYRLSLGQRRFIVGASLILLLLLALSCFYLRFTIALLPVAFPSPTASLTATLAPSLTPTHTPTASPTYTASPTFTVTPSRTPTATASPTASLTATITPTPSQTLTPTVTPTPVQAFTNGNVWVHLWPSDRAIRFTTLPPDTAVKILGVYGSWYNVQWISEDGGLLGGWIYAPLITLREELPPSIFTPTTTPTGTPQR